MQRRINEYIPHLRAEGRFLSQGQDQARLREELRDEAVALFSVQAEYSERIHQWRLQRSFEEVKGLVKTIVPMDLERNYRGILMSALKKIVLEDDHSYGVTSPPAFKNAEGIYDTETIRDFITQNWKRLGDVAWHVHNRRSAEHLKKKELKEKADLQ